ncbi:type II toxin-antitoxin system PemK/MazF family toxin [Escherichia coli]|nr:type II toxin-antitoxin system PemK/MazF family toxin [Escherichia coli]
MVSRYVPDMGDLIWVDFDPTKGSEQAGHRPAVCPQSVHVQQQNQVCVCVFLVQRNQKDIRLKLFYPVRNVMA